ncbi:uncharacterized protein [Primulina huaijiensis]|uniref:uncharacterized protein n=1 Tax=Primulina huaijiensis TaxID=1492673 RepID=UPI003CC70817
MRHPVDLVAWDTINHKWPNFASDPRNLRLGLATDGFNLFGDLSSRYSCWPVILVNYNLPSLMCMTKENLMLTLLIPGPKQPGNDIDIYLEPLVEDLKELWDTGVEAYDAFNKSMFNLKVTGDFFPLIIHFVRKRSGLMGKKRGEKNETFEWKKSDTVNTSSKKRKKQYNSKELRKPVQMWKKMSIFFDLPYWSGLLLRHNIDVMHVEKNVCENIIGTLLNQKKKSKDGVNARKDLMHLKIREKLHPQEKGENKYHLPAAPYTLSKKEIDIFCCRLKKIKLPDGYSSNICNCVSLEERKLIGLKSHDCHVLMQQLLSVALRNLLPKGPRNAIYLLGAFYNELCQRVLDRNRLEQLEENIAEILCMLERYFSPAFFTISVHLTIHLAREARLCGPVQFRWMYPFESAYIKKASTIGVRYNQNDDLENGLVEGRSISKGKEKILEDHVLQAAHRYVLFNTAEVEPYLRMHNEELKQIDRRFLSNETLLQKQHMETFAEWLSKQVLHNYSGRIQWLAHGPRKQVTSYTGYIINGHRFHTVDVGRSTQDSGVSIEADTICQSNADGYSHTLGRISYYGVIRDIVLLAYYSFKVPVFRCDWANPGTGVKIEDGFTLVNLHHRLKTFESDPFILASQAKQVFYSRDDDESNWYVLLKEPPRGIHNMNVVEEDAYTSSTPLDVSQLEINITEKEPYARNECDGIDVTET